MPLFGAHKSIAGGYDRAILTAEEHRCEAVQLFTKNCNQWRAKELTEEEVAAFRGAFRASKVRVAMGHDCYLINLASPEPDLYRKSVEAFVLEYIRAERLGLRYLVTHPGSHLDSGEEAGLARVAHALDEIHARCPDCRVRILLENTAGQGTNLGHRFEHLAKILSLVKEPHRLGVCLDTCHCFAAGYPLAPELEYRTTMETFDRVVGVKWLLAFHLNDSRKPLGSRVDRHAHIGRGCMGLEPFRLLVNDPRFRRHPMVLETPKEAIDGRDMDEVNLKVLRSLVKGVSKRRPLAKPARIHG
jgi:deoxyribonuclease IV